MPTEEQCFSYLDGFQVKDAAARADITKLKSDMIQRVIKYDTVAIMLAMNPSINYVCKTIGKESINDGLGATYLIRAKESGEVESDNLIFFSDGIRVAEKIVSESDTKISANTSSIETNTSNIAENTSSIAENENNINLLTNKNIIAITDSYGTHSQLHWGYWVKNNLSLTNDKFHFLAEGASGFIHSGLNGHTFLTLLQSFEINNPENITDIVVCGGTNDFYYFTSVDDIISSISSFCFYVKEKFVNAKVSIGFIGNIKTKDSDKFKSYISTISAYINGASLSGAKYLGNVENVMHIPNIYEDTMHPNDNGNKILGNAITQGILNGEYKTLTSGYVITNNIILSQVLTAASNNVNLSGSGNHLSFSLNDNITMIGTDTILFTLTTPISISNVDGFDFATFDLTYCNVPVVGFANIQVSMLSIDSSNNRTTIPAYLTLSKINDTTGKITINVENTITNVSTIRIGQSKYYMPTLYI